MDDPAELDCDIGPAKTRSQSTFRSGFGPQMSIGVLEWLSKLQPTERGQPGSAVATPQTGNRRSESDALTPESPQPFH